MDSWHSYPKVFALGHRAITDLLDGIVLIQEKVDGSQFSFGVNEAGAVHVRSKGRVFDVDLPDGMFTLAAARVKELAPSLVPGWTYRGEYLNKPKHNALAYDRTPRGNIILFDVSTGVEAYLGYAQLEAEAARLGLEVVPTLYHGPGRLLAIDDIAALLDGTSVLGGMREGVVIKNYTRFSEDGHALMGKFVSEVFKEVHRRDWTKSNPSSGDILDQLLEQFRTEARWVKAVQHLREAGVLQTDPRDIGPLMAEAKRDFLEECEVEVKGMLWAWAKKKVLDRVTRGLPEWYKKQLLEGQFKP